MRDRPLEILLVEDSLGDVELVKAGLLRGDLGSQLHVARDGVEALEFLRGEGSQAEPPRPDLVLLDINLPRMNGHEVLAEIRGDARLRSIPVIVLTTSEHENDVLQAYANRANAYVTKPLRGSEFVEVVRSIETYWGSIATLPTRTDRVAPAARPVPRA